MFSMFLCFCIFVFVVVRERKELLSYFTFYFIIEKRFKQITVVFFEE